MNDQLALFDTSVVNNLTQKLEFPAGLVERLAHSERLRVAAAAEFNESDEVRCRRWFEQSYLCPPFDSLPEYERTAWLWRYRVERGSVHGAKRCMMTARQVFEAGEARFQEEESIARSWASEIKQAAVERRPCPFSESEDMTGFERLRFRRLLARAFDIAGVVIVPADAPPEPARRRRRAPQAA